MDKSQIQKRTKELLRIVDNIEKFIEELCKFLESEREKKRFEQIKRIIPDAYRTKVFGTRHIVLNIIADQIGRFGEKNIEQSLRMIRALWNDGSFEERIIAAKSLERIGKVNYKATLELITIFSKDISNWAVCDDLGGSAMRFITPLHPDKVFSLCNRWIKDENKWVRRFGVVSLIPLVRDKKYQFSGEEFEIIAGLMEDKDKDVQKAVSWILREITKKNPDDVAEFLTRWAKANPGKDTRWIIKDGMKKLPKEHQDELGSIIGG